MAEFDNLLDPDVNPEDVVVYYGEQHKSGKYQESTLSETCKKCGRSFHYIMRYPPDLEEPCLAGEQTNICQLCLDDDMEEVDYDEDMY